MLHTDEQDTSAFKRCKENWTRALLAAATFQGLDGKLIPEQAMFLFPRERQQWVPHGPCLEQGCQGSEMAGSIKGHQSHKEHFLLDSGSSYFCLDLSQLGPKQKHHPAEAEHSSRA